MNDIERWKQKGLIDETLAQTLSEETKCEGEKLRRLAIQITVYTVGIIFAASGIISFIAGNDWILELFNNFPVLKEILLLILTLGVFFGGYNLKYEKNKYVKLGGSLIFLSTMLVGANYALLGQTYHWDSNCLILYLWFLSIYPMAFIFKSKAINRVSLILFIFAFCYMYEEIEIDKIEAWTVIIPFSLCSILYTFANTLALRRNYREFSLDYKIVSLVSAFVTFLILTFSVNDSYNLPYLCYSIVPFCLMIICFINYLLNYSKAHDENEKILLGIETIFLIALCIFEIFLLFSPKLPGFVIASIAHVFIICIVSCLIYWGYTLKHNSLITLSNWFLLIYIICIYTRFGWSFIDKTLFFLVGSFILVGVGMYLEKEKNVIIQNKNNDEVKEGR